MAFSCLDFIPADAGDRSLLLALQTEYLSWVFAGLRSKLQIDMEQIQGKTAGEYAAAGLDTLCIHHPPQRHFYLIRYQDQWIGMVGLREIASGVAEIKRLYLQPAWQGKGLGKMVLQHLEQLALDSGYRLLRLDSAPFMEQAQGLYLRCGFTDCAPYPQTEVPPELHGRWRFMEKLLD